MPRCRKTASTPIVDIISTLNQAIALLSPKSDSARTDAELLLAQTLNKPRSYLYTWPDTELTPDQQKAFSNLLNRRLNGEPIAYILGKKEFWSLELLVSTATLIPRPETELLVEIALEKLPEHKTSYALDLGTGSGAIACALAKERPLCQVLAIEFSHDALTVARKNKEQLKLNNLTLEHSHWFDAIGESLHFDVIVSNPPYIAPDDPHLTQGDLRFEPNTALSTTNDGLADLFHIAQNAKKYLKPNGWLIMEHGYNQSAELINKLKALNYQQVTDHNDYNNQPRIISGQI